MVYNFFQITMNFFIPLGLIFVTTILPVKATDTQYFDETWNPCDSQIPANLTNLWKYFDPTFDAKQVDYLLCLYPKSNISSNARLELMNDALEANVDFTQFYVFSNNPDFLEAKDSFGRTALFHQIDDRYIGNATNVEWLVRNGANVNARDNEGNTPLILGTNHK